MRDASSSGWESEGSRRFRSARASGISCSARPSRGRCGAGAATARCAAPDANGVRLPEGFRSRIVARGDQVVAGTDYRWHIASDGMATFPAPGRRLRARLQLRDTSSAAPPRCGSAATAQVRDAYRILSGTTQNCSGGGTPWGTWLSCEEIEDGRVWECDPSGRRQRRRAPGDGHLQARGGRRRPARALRLHDRGPDRRRPLPLHAASAGPTSRPGCSRSPAWAAAARSSGSRCPTRPRRARALAGRCPAAPASSAARGSGSSGHTLYVSTTADDRVHAYDTRRERIRVVYDGLASAQRAVAARRPDDRARAPARCSSARTSRPRRSISE